MKLSLEKDLGPLRLAAYDAVDRHAGTIRTRYITTIAGQDMVYLEKRREAEDFMSGARTSPAELPHLERESQLNGISLFDQAVEFLTLAHQWSILSAQIECDRVGAKRAVDAASSPAAIDAVIAALR